MKNTLTIICAVFISTISFSQRKTSFSLPLKSEFILQEVDSTFQPTLFQLEAPAPDGNSEKAIKKAKKKWLDEQRAKKLGIQNTKAGEAPLPQLNIEFRANYALDGIPLDNDLAISDSGQIISVVNSNIYIYDTQGKRKMSTSLRAFFEGLNLKSREFDPRVIYDHNADRFIMACLSGSESRGTSILLGVSQTHDPLESWNLYQLPGNPLGDSTWTDYPIVALNGNDLFVTGNFIQDDVHWSVGFRQSIIWQVGLSEMYEGETMEATLYDSIQYQGEFIRNICPLNDLEMSGDNDELYFVSNRNQQLENDSLWVLKLADDDNNGDYDLTTTVLKLNETYGFPPDAYQINNLRLSTNDARWLSGYRYGNQLHFVGNTVTPSALVGVYHGMVNNFETNPQATGHILSDTLVEYGYPAITRIANSQGEHAAIIVANSSSAQMFPSTGAFYYDGDGNYSDYLQVWEGNDNMNMLSGPDRWGDYMGVQTRYNNHAEVWMSGTFGTPSKIPATRVASFWHPEYEPVGILAHSTPTTEVYVVPNPMAEKTSIEFTTNKTEVLEIAIYNSNGKLIDVILKDKVKEGLNRFRFSTYSLSSGVYIIRATNESGELVMSEQVVK